MTQHSKYTDDQLDSISHERLYRLFQIARARLSDYQHNTFMDDDFGDCEAYYAEIQADYDHTKAALSRRPYRKFNRETKREERRQKLSGLKGNRRQRTGK